MQKQLAEYISKVFTATRCNIVLASKARKLGQRHDRIVLLLSLIFL